MNFTELFAKLPTSTLQDWETAARKQLKGKPLEDIDVSMHNGALSTPYAIGTRPSVLGGASQGWIQYSSFLPGQEVSGATLLQALNDGAQGLEVSFEELKRISSEIKEIRFDFISLKVSQLDVNDQSALLDMIPVAQRENSNLVVALYNGADPKEYKVLGEGLGSVKFMLSPKLIVGESGSLTSIMEETKRIISSIEDPSDCVLLMSQIGVEIVLSNDYLKNIVFIQALRILFANIYHSFGVAEPLPRPYFFGRIRYDGDTNSHENYLIDATARAVAGLSGGLDALSIEGFPGDNQSLASRRVRNVQNVLAIEGMLGVPVNAVAGAAFFESSAIELVKSIWPEA